MGSVSLAHDHATGAACALKRVHITDGAAAVGRLQAEFAALSRVRHPALVEVRDLVFERGASPVLVMEFVPGLPADQVVPHGDVEMLVRVALRAAEALAALHDAGVVHGDLKPANLLVSPGSPDDVRLVDLGLADVAGHVRPSFAGTQGYAAGELRRGERATVATDLFALGATMHALLTGALPHSSRSSELSTESRELPSDARALEREGAPPPLVSLILQLMASAPAERPRDARSVVRALTRLLPSARRSLRTRLDAVRFVGRERELERILAAHRSSTSGPARVLVHGEPGLGKTALLDAAATRLRSDGMCVAALTAGATPLHGLAITLAGAADALPPDSTALREWLDDPQAPLSPTELEGLLHRITACAATMARAGRPAAIVVDDLDRLDDATRAALRRLALSPECSALHLWSATRVDAATAQLVHAGEMARIPLKPLDRDERRAFTAARLGAPTPEALREDLDRHAAGHPARILQRLHAVIAAGAVSEHEGGLLANTATLEAVSPSDDGTAVILARCAEIPGAEAALLALTVSPRALGADALLQVSPGADGATLSALLDCHLLREEAGSLRLDSPALAEEWLRGLPEQAIAASRRRLLEQVEFSPIERFRLLAAGGEAHAALAVAGAIRDAGLEATIAREAAEIAERIGDDRACHWRLCAAREARRVGRYADAEHEYAAARARATGDAASEATEGWINARVRTGRLQGMAEECRLALASAPSARWRCPLLLQLAALGLDDLPQQEVLALIDAAREQAERCDSPELRAQSGRMRADTLRYFGRHDEAIAQVEETLQQCAGLASVTMLRLESLASALLHRAGRRVEALERLERVQRSAAARGERFAQVDAILMEVGLRMEQGDWQTALARCEDAFRLALALDLPRTAALSASNLLLAAALTGDMVRFARRFRRVRRLAERWMPAGTADLDGRIRALAERSLGRPARGRRCLERAMADRRLHLDAQAQSWSALTLARCDDECDALERAAQGLERLLADGVDGLERALALAHRGLLLVRLGRLPEAEQDLLQLQPTEIDGWGQASAHRAVLAAACAIARGDRLAAEERAAEAIRRFQALPAPHEMAMALLTLAELAARHGRLELPVSLWIEHARERAERLGNASAQMRALELRERWGRLTTPTVARTEDMSWLAEVSLLVQHIPSTTALAQKAMAIVCQRIKSERGVLLLVDRGKQTDPAPLQVVATYGEVDEAAQREAVGYSSDVVRSVIKSGVGIRNSDIPRDPRMNSKSLTDMRVRFVLCEPLRVAERTIGAVYLQDRMREQDFDRQDTLRLEAFARIMAAALEQSWRQAAMEVEHERLVDAHAMLKQRTGARFANSLMIGEHVSMQRINALIERVAARDSMVLITGASGTGKEMVARSIHAQSPRRDGPFVEVNCGAFNPGLIESELFGIRGNVATGVTERAGRFEHAHGGTLFLDEIAEMPMEQQVRLLRVLQTREVTRIGAEQATPVDVRIIAATNRDLEQRVADGLFRSDLYFRINVVPIHLPPLSERRSDIPALARHFVAKIAARFGHSTPRLTPRFVESLLQYHWPGNVRELENYLERVMLLESGDVLESVSPPGLGQVRTVASPVLERGSLDDQLEQVRRERILAALESCSGNQSRAAQVLQVGEPKLRFWMKKLNIPTSRNISRDA